MSTSVKQDNDFRDALIPNDLLEQSIDWIKTHLSPDEVFGEEGLKTWANTVWNPDEVFTERELLLWATENGYTKE